MRTRKQIKSDRLWRHWLYWVGDAIPFGPDLKPIQNYDPNQWRSEFERFQSKGPSGMSSDVLWHIAPLIAAQRAKEVFLTSLAEESLEFWSEGAGWALPWLHTIDTRNRDRPMDRLTYVAILRTMKSIKVDPLNFFMRHPGISEKRKKEALAVRVASIDASLQCPSPTATSAAK